uniref:non-specific serine/threonine protein kinase n=1 Tax=Opuntia streptacantha TaxID=393608 RepID=A0A7C9E410_OPUST
MKSCAIFIALLTLFCQGVSFISGRSTGNHNRSNKYGQTDGNDTRGYISIDCGNTEGDSTYYQSDAAFIDTGVNKEISPDLLPYMPPSYCRTVRRFPDGERNCYTLKPLNGRDNSYLIRAHFMYGNYDGQNRAPVFNVYVGVSFWGKVMPVSPFMEFVLEIIHKPSTDFIYICLVDIGQGTPFISALLLRPLNNSTYVSDLGSLRTIMRLSTDRVASVSQTAQIPSYSEDKYGRIWPPLPPIASSPSEGWEVFSTSTDLSHLKNDAYEVPLSILKGGIRPSGSNHSFTFNLPGIGQGIHPSFIFSIYWHFAETQKLDANESRELNIFASNNFDSGPITLKYMEAVTVVAPAINIGPDSVLWFTINQTNDSSLPPILNAFEIYAVTKLSHAATNQHDVNAIMDVKTQYYKLLNGWHGDPCLPAAPWNGVNCSDSNSDSPRITSLNLASRGLTGEILPALSSLTSLSYLNLSHNELTGTVPEFLAKLPSLIIIDLRENKLSGSVPTELMEKARSGSLSLSLDGNPDLCTMDVCMKKSKKLTEKHMVWVSLVAFVFLALVLLAVAVFCFYRWKRKAGSTTAPQSVLHGGDGMESKNRKFSYSEVMNMTNKLQTIIGKGGFGTVYHGCLKDGTEVAIKILKGSSIMNVQSFRTEAELLMRVHHRSLVSLVGYCDERCTMALIYEYMANGNLQEHLSGERTRTLGWKERLQISIDAAEGLEYLHCGCKPAVIHRDLKTANILLDHRVRAKLADFGISRIFSTESATHISTDHVAGTPGYLAPE